MDVMRGDCFACTSLKRLHSFASQRPKTLGRCTRRCWLHARRSTSLGLSYRVINIVSGALNNAAAKRYDLEAFFPTMGVYRELVSASNCTDYQSRAMEVKFGHKHTRNQAMGEGSAYVHMLNATLCATERTICCLLENYQTSEGVTVPEVLRPYLGGLTLIPYTQAPPKATATADKTRTAPTAVAAADPAISQ